MLASEATIPATDEGLIRGDGVFEVIRVYDGRPYAFDRTCPRLERSAANLRLPVDLEAVRAEPAACSRRPAPVPSTKCCGSW